MISQPADRAKDAFKFLKEEFPHCEDMLQYLGKESGHKLTKEVFEDNEI
jgi:hypothetical protein